MQVNLTSERAIEIAETHYAGLSKTLTKSGKREPHSLDWWLQNPHSVERNPDTDRVRGGVRTLLDIVAESGVEMPHNSFPAHLALADGKSIWPDKGQVKTLFFAGRLCARWQADELIFQLTNSAAFE